jgi:uncharacterized protein with beta-barrel porin domain
MKNPVQRRLQAYQWATVLGVFLTSSALHAEPTPDWYLPTAADWIDLQLQTSPGIAPTEFSDNFHIPLLTPTNAVLRPSLDSASFIDNRGKLLNPAIAGPNTDWANPGTGNWFVSTNWSNGIPNSTATAVVANGGTAVVEASPTPPPDCKSANRIEIRSPQSNAAQKTATAQVGTLIIGSLNGPGGTVIIGPGGILDVFQSLTVEANGSLRSLTGRAVYVLHGGTVTNSGTIMGAGTALEMDGGGTVDNNQNALISGGSSSYGIRAGNVKTGTGVLDLVNSGTISGGTGVLLQAGGTILNNSTGKIEGLDGTGMGIQTTGAPVNIKNFGIVSGNVDGISIGSGVTLINEAGGSITAKTERAILVLGGSASIANFGAITGGNGVAIDTTLSKGNTSVSNAGTVNGSVELGDGINTVTLLTGGIINGNLDLGSNTASRLILDGSGQQLLTTAVTGTITDLGSLTKQGSGTWIIDEDLSAPISTDVIAGTLTIQNATLTSSAVTIGSGGTVTGIGTIAGNVTNSGVISPGNPFGTLTISGNYTQTSSGIFRLQLAGLTPGSFGVLAVTGQATLGGTLQIVPVGNIQFLPGDKAVFLTAKTISGSFSTIQNLISPNTLVDAKVVVLSNAVEVEAVQGDFTTVACNPNSLAVAKALNSAVGDSRATALINFLDSQPIDQLCADFTLISPEEIAAVFSLDVSLANIQSANLQRRLEDIRAGSTGFSSSGFTINGSAPSYIEGLSGPTGAEGKTGPSVSAPIPENRWGFFATGLGEFTDVSSSDGARGFNFQTGGVTLGVDYRIGSNFAIGLTGGYAHTGVDLANNGSIDVNGGSGGFYATAFSGGLYLDTSVTGGASDYETHRTGLLGTANGSTDSGTVNVLAAGGYDWTKGALTIGPIASFQYTYVSLNGFTETGSLAPLKYGDQSIDSIRTALGIKASYDWKIGGVLIRPELRASWQHEYADSTYSIVAAFANGAGNNFTVTGPRIGRDSLLIGAGAAILWSDRISTYIYYDGELARENYDSQSVTAGVRLTF